PYACSVKIISKQISPIPLLKVSKPDKIVRIQKRDWVRLPHNTVVKYKLAGYNVDYFETRSIDISGGGILLQTNHPIDINETLEIIFSLDNITISTTSKVVRCTPADNSYRVALKFNEISETERDKIVGFIFQKQREFIKKGLM
ncbi:MAG: PilZ domain-containing protein, partial [Syntrophomonadaceae bacterium]|nr:PilZ domain-containing protein [Syntrophomonadaceae bacterium]